MPRERAFPLPFMLGFDVFEDALERVSKAGADGYPPYNVESLGPDKLLITIAVAGFDEDALSVTVENNELTIAGRQTEEQGERVFLHRGIAARAFQRRFVLADGMEISGATLDKGLLHIELVRPRAEDVSRTIKIRHGRPQSA